MIGPNRRMIILKKGHHPGFIEKPEYTERTTNIAAPASLEPEFGSKGSCTSLLYGHEVMGLLAFRSNDSQSFCWESALDS